ncbi:MAG: S9 family peptidase [Stappiaceae bacterium]
MKKRLFSLLASFLLLTGMFLLQPAAAQQQWTPELSTEVNRLSDLAFSPDDTHILYGINSMDIQKDVYLNEYVISDLTGTTVRTLIEPSSSISAAQWAPDGQMVAYLSSQTGKNNIWLVRVDGSEKPRQVTDMRQDIANFRWAPDSGSIAFMMTDPDYKEPDVENPDVFNRNHLWLLRLDTDNTSDNIVNLTEKQDFTVSTWAGNLVYDWSPDSTSVAFAYQDRPGLDAMVKAQIASVDVQSRQVTKIETGNRNWAYFPKYSPDGNWLAYIKAPGPFKWSFLWDIKLIPVSGGKPVSLAKSKNGFPFLWQWAPDSRSVYYIENDRSTYSFYTMPINGDPPTKIFGSPQDLSVPGLNTYLTSSFVDVSNDGKQVAIIGQTFDKPPEIYVGKVEDFSPKKVSTVNRDFTDIPIGKTELIRWRSLDNTEVEALLTYPVKYEKDKKYPLVVQIHGGPNSVDFNEYLPLMKFFATAAYSAKDHFILRVNYRGSFGYGKKFREDLIGNFGIFDYQDIISGVDHVIDLGLADPAALFVIGQSNGGTLTGWIITQTDMFKAACPVAGETDYISLEGTNGYFQTSWYLGGSFIDHLQTYLDRSPIFHVKNVKTPTLIQGGLLDDNVPHTQLQEFYRALKRVGVDTQLVGYPGVDHDYFPPKLYLKLLRSCMDWTDRHRVGE